MAANISQYQVDLARQYEGARLAVASYAATEIKAEESVVAPYLFTDIPMLSGVNVIRKLVIYWVQNFAIVAFVCACFANSSHAETFVGGKAERCKPKVEPGRLSRVTNQASQCYEVNQTYDGQVYYKDNNLWVYSREFADLFGMPEKFVGDIKGAEAAAFRVEDASYQQCGFGGKEEVCRKVEHCLLDIYIDEKKSIAMGD